MLHTKFRGNRPAGSREEDFYRVFTIYGHGGHLGHVTSIMSSDFQFLVLESFHTKFGSDQHSTVRLPIPGHFYSCVVSKYLLRENEISFLLL